MARSFTAASSEQLSRTSAVVSGAPLTMACWGYPTDNTIVSTLMSLGHNSSANCYILDIVGTIPNDPFRLYELGGTTDSSTNVNNPTFNAWSHFCGVFASSSSRTLYLNGSATAGGTNNIGSSTLNRTTIGAVYFGADPPINFLSGRVAEAGIWNAALTAEEVAALAAGYSPLSIRPQSLVSYWPLLARATDEEDWVGGNTLTASGTSAVEHPRIIRPRSVRYFLGTAGVNQGVAESSGTSAVTALSGSIAASAGAATAAAVAGYVALSAGVATAGAVAGSVGESSGASTASALAGALGEATGIATVTGLSGAVGQSAGTSTAAAISESAVGAGAADGTSTATGVAGFIGQAAGTSAADAYSSSSAALGESSGTSTATAIAGSIGQVSGTSTADGIASSAYGVGESAGTSNVIALSGSLGITAGTSTATALQGSAGTSSGTATVLAFSGAVAQGTGAAEALGLAGAIGRATSTSTAEAIWIPTSSTGAAAGTATVLGMALTEAPPPAYTLRPGARRIGNSTAADEPARIGRKAA